MLSDIPELQPYIVEHPHQESPTYSQLHLAYFHLPGGLDFRNGPRLGYGFKRLLLRSEFSLWGYREGWVSQHTTYHSLFVLGGRQPSCLSETCNSSYVEKGVLAEYIRSTIHTSNDILSSQADCPADLSVDEFIALGHLRSGGSLQWLNILRDLRSRSLNLRSHEVHFLLAQATSEVGPLDVDSGEWV